MFGPLRHIIGHRLCWCRHIVIVGEGIFLLLQTVRQRDLISTVLLRLSLRGPLCRLSIKPGSHRFSSGKVVFPIQRLEPVTCDLFLELNRGHPFVGADLLRYVLLYQPETVDILALVKGFFRVVGNFNVRHGSICVVIKHVDVSSLLELRCVSRRNLLLS